ncbi:MAG: nitroreductase family protein [Fimbriimonadaceae bacterium]|nr:nitroreductase family protein [Fimbriimonadaceae bacterium]
MFEESSAQAWRLRYGSEPPVGLPELDRLTAHRSVRKFSAEPVPEPVVQGLVLAAQSAATSSNLQMWTLVSVQDPEARERIALACGDQQQIRDAAWFFAVCADLHRLDAAARAAGEEPDALTTKEMFLAAVIDAALAAERLVCAAEDQGLGTCYIGALRNQPEQIREILGLPDRVFGVFGLCLGHPVDGAEIKPRLAQPGVWHRESYQAATDIEEYNLRMKTFYESQRMSGDHSWAARSGRRCRKGKISGREAVTRWVQEFGLDLE